MSATAPSSPATRPSGAAAAPRPQQPPNASLPQPLIPLSFIDAPSQRFYACSLAIATQAWKYTHVVKALFSTSDDASSAFSLSTAILVDFTVLFVLSRLGIPRLDPRLAAAATPARPAQATSSISASPSQGPGLTYARYAVIFGSLVLVDSILLGQGTANPVVWLFSTLLGFLKAASSLVGLELDLGPLGADAFARQLSISEGRVRIRDLVQPKSHILGQHTVHILPYSTAKLSPSSACYCAGPGTPSVTIPVLFNNTEPDLLQYSVTDFVTGEAALFNISVTDLVVLPASRAGRERPDEDLQVAAAAATKNRKHDVEGLGADEDELDEPLSFLKGSTYQERARLRAAKRSKGAKSAVCKGPAGAVGRTKAATQLLYHLPVHSAGRVRLERVLDKARNDARLSSAEALVVECPTSTFVAPKSAVAEASNWLEAAHKCPGESAELAVQVRGLTPLELQYRRSWEPSAQQGSGRNRHVEPLDEVQTISRISSPHHASPLLLPEAESILSPVERIALAQERTRAAARSAGNTHEDYAWAAASEVSIPLSVELERAGRYTYELESVKDACGNVVKAHGQAAPSLGPGSKVKRKLVKGMGKDVPSTVTSQQVVVHPRAKFAFSARSCQPGYPIKMLRTQSHLNVSLLANDGDRESGPWEVDLHFDPDNSAAGQDPLARAPATPWVRPLTMESGAGIAQVQVSAPGTYRIGKARGRYCTGEVESPWTCEVIDVPPPTAKISFSSIEDRCAGPVGVKALSILTGSPPFELEYEVRRHGERSHPIRRRIMQTRDELEFRPNTEGPVTYRFLKLHDANYRNMILDGPSFTQDVHPLATARFAASHGRSAGQPIVVHSCAGNRAQADVELGGTGPWDLTYIVRGAGRSETKEVKKLTSPRHTLDFELAPELVEAGGRATVSLVSIRDAKGCERQLATSDLNIEIRKARSTVGFLPVTYDTRRQVEILDGRQTRLPLRLEGDGPWTVTYSWRADESSPEQEETLQLSDSSAAIPARRPGVYTIKSIRDAYCPGSVLADQESYHVHVRSRPAVHFVEDAGQVVRNGSVVRAPVCQGRPDAVDVRMTGNFPLQIAYEHQAPSWSGGADVDGSQALGSAIGEIASQGKRRRNSFTSAQTVSNLELSTLTPGWHTYTIESVGDTAYPPAALQGFPRDAPRRLEQMVYPLPSASFVHGGKVPSFCIGDSLDGKTHEGKASGGFEPTVRLSGTPPFTVEFELHDITSRSSASASAVAAGGSRSHVKTIVRSDVTTHDYRLRIPRSDFTFETTGKWTLQVTRVRDAHGCEFAPLSAGRAVPASARIELEVAETAGISASSTRDDYCVGESVDFVLQGTPPWTVTYDFEGKTTRAVSRRPEFARVAERPGTLRIKSVAHQQNQCRTLLDEGKVEGMVKTIHDLPSVRVSEGRHYVEDLREGNQAEIIFDLVGEAPFSFTYQRTEPADTHSRPKVLETHTVQGILEDRFSIWTSVEGTWSVTWLMDRWCQVSLDAHSGSSTSLGKSRLATTPS